MRKKTLFHRVGAMAMAFTLSMSLMVTPAFAAGGDHDFTDGDKDGYCDVKIDVLCGKEAADAVHGDGEGQHAFDGTEGGTCAYKTGEKDCDVHPWSRPEFTEGYKASLMAVKALTVKNAVVGATYNIYPVLTVKDIQENDGMLLFQYAVPDARNDADRNPEVMRAIMADLAAGEFGYASAQAVSFTEGDKSCSVKAGLVTKDDYVGFQVTVDGDLAMDVQTAYTRWSADRYGQTFASKFADALKARIDAAIKDGVEIRKGEEAETVKYVRDEDGKVTKTAVKEGATTGTTTVTFEDIPVGYYIITSSAGKNVMSFTLPGQNDQWEINEKNTAPTVKKESYDDATGEFASANDKAIGDTVLFRSELDVGSGIAYLKFVDTLSKGLTFDRLISVQFYPRNAEGQASTGNDAKTVNRPVYLDSNTSANGASNDANNFGSIELIDLTYAKEGEWINEGDLTLKTPFSSFNFDAKVDGQVLTVDFSNQWLTSKRIDGDFGSSSADREDYTRPPMYENDDRLYDDDGNLREGVDETGAMHNQYLGDMTTAEDDGGKIVILYAAKINKDAVIGGTGNTNAAKLQYGNDPDSDNWLDSNEDKTHTYVYELDILKHAKGDSATKLAGAEFQLRRAGNAYDYAGKDGYVYLPNGDNALKGLTFAGSSVTVSKAAYEAAKAIVDNKATEPLEFILKDGTYRTLSDAERKMADADRKALAGYTTTLKSDAQGRIMVSGLDSDLYRLDETKAPDGYILADAPFYAILGSVSSGSADVKDAEVTMHAYVPAENPTDASGNYVFERTKASVEKTSAGADGAEAVKTSHEAVGIANASGIKMPDTGGIGTTIFYTAGAVLVLAAGVLLVVKKRAGHSED